VITSPYHDQASLVRKSVVLSTSMWIRTNSRQVTVRLQELRGVTLLVSTLTVPDEDCFDLGHGGNLSQGLLAQLSAKPSEFVTLALGQLYTAVDLVARCDVALRLSSDAGPPD
jgi:hypothetical protein